MKRVHQDLDVEFMDLREKILDVLLILGVVKEHELDVYQFKNQKSWSRIKEGEKKEGGILLAVTKAEMNHSLKRSTTLRYLGGGGANMSKGGWAMISQE